MLRLHRAGLPWSLGSRARGWRGVALSAREAAKREGEVRDALRGVVDRDLSRDVVTLGMAKHLRVDPGGERVSCQIESLPGRDACRSLGSDAEAALRALPWVRHADVEVVAPYPQPLKPSLMPAGLASVANVVAVASGKGGVGKSTVAVHLARALRQRGARVGIFDADLYGPSIPTLLGTTGVAAEPAYSSEEAASSGDPAAAQMVKPVLAWGDVPTMSIGYSAQQQQREGEAAVMRGPMASNVLRQLLSFTQWGALDFLVVDLPPGTGDIQLTLTQNVALTAAVVVTTPNRLARPDVVKGINMFGRVRVPTAALVENMSYFQSPDGSRQAPFGRSHAADLQREFLVPHLCTLPLDPALADEDLSTCVAPGHRHPSPPPIPSLTPPSHPLPTAQPGPCGRGRRRRGAGD